jgi:hypothetical protein
MSDKMEIDYYYIFECGACYSFYGEQKLNEDGELLCPNCKAPERIDSPFVERVAVIGFV